MALHSRRRLVDLPVSVRVGAAVLAALLLAVIAGALAFTSTRSSAAAAREVYQNAVLPTATLGDLREDFFRTRLAMANHAAAPTKEMKDSLVAGFPDTDRSLDASLSSLAREDAIRDEDLAEISRLVQEYRYVRSSTLIPLSDKKDLVGYKAAVASKVAPISDALSERIKRLESELATTSENLVERIHSDSGRLGLAVLVVLGIGIVISVLLSIWVAKSVTRPLQKVSDVAGKLASGDLTARVELDTKDEIGRMGADLDAGLENLQKAVARVLDASSEVGSMAGLLRSGTASISSAAGHSAQRAAAAASACEQVSGSVRMVATASEEMAASIADVSGNAIRSTDQAKRAAEDIGSASATVNRLGESSVGIAEVVNVIQAIAAQTKLLALNATIEAARAGEAGKSFSVVASEVKNLASQTAQASDDVASRVNSIRGDAEAVVSAIAQIQAVMGGITEGQNAIAGAVAEQKSVTGQTAALVSEAAQGSASIAADVVEVSDAASRTQAQADELDGIAERLGLASAGLQREMAAFTVA